MKRYSKRILYILLLAAILLLFVEVRALAEPQSIELPNIDISIGDSSEPTNYVSNLRLLILLTILTMLPSFIIMMTSFTRIIVSFSFLKSALGTQQSIPNQVFIGLALFLTIFIMAPVYKEINSKALMPFMNEEINQEEAMEYGSKPLREFMLKQTRQKDLELFVEIANLEGEELTEENVPLYVVVPAFAISELKTAFQIGFLLYIPFIIIDLVVASVLMSMGMFMLPPAQIALPFKLLLFVMVDGWYLIVKSLIISFT